MQIMFLRFRRCLASKRKDPVDFAVTSASFVELALRVNFIIMVIKEDVSEKLGSFVKPTNPHQLQVLREISYNSYKT
jgi:hypothetical protein